MQAVRAGAYRVIGQDDDVGQADAGPHRHLVGGGPVGKREARGIGAIDQTARGEIERERALARADDTVDPGSAGGDAEPGKLGGGIAAVVDCEPGWRVVESGYYLNIGLAGGCSRGLGGQRGYAKKLDEAPPQNELEIHRQGDGEDSFGCKIREHPFSGNLFRAGSISRGAGFTFPRAGAR